ncbi:MAG: bifunctional demethylmenaquinone methyltransferase/2-methoxy-6-polyprenyl-1,4-benzoquinol methylase UbiE [Candidatus Levybacteria bacterium]|nr:bifunctional demethylmenaquinone methyltransferase/2-methoxy-6-polyprenyl-1,4-benzoquinol methylase UbiE [Candidatus Levybacteria bacterium]
MTKKQQVTRMFDNIAGTYDFLNHLLSLGIDIYWRKKAIGILKSRHPLKILDIAAGTGDFAIEAVKLNPERIIGVDISEKMLAKAKEKIKKLHLENEIKFQLADCENLPFKDNSFDAITVGFGVRNFVNLEKGLSEMYRVLEKDGIVVILEFSKPKTFLIKNIFNLYFKNILPFVGGLVSKDKEAYAYLPQSVQNFPEGEDFLKILEGIGFSDTKQIKLTFGIASIYVGRK